MRRDDGGLTCSPTDLVVFARSTFSSWMDRRLAEEPGFARPDPTDPFLAALSRQGQERELQHVGAIRSAGQIVRSADGEDSSDDWANAAMSAGAEVLHQPPLSAPGWEGRPDLLVRVDRPSLLGAWSYEPLHCKLARTESPEHLLQLAAYADLLERVQGVRPEFVRIIGGDGVSSAVRTAELFFYYLALKEAFLAFQRSFDPARPPAPDGHADHGRWFTYAKRWLKEQDSLTQVAGITRHQARRLEKAGISTMTALGQSAIPRVPRMEQSTYEGLREQASLQVMSSGRSKPRFRVIRPPASEQRGLGALPPVSPGDLYFDIEGYPLLQGGLEYLFGVLSVENQGLKFRELWAHDSAQERTSLADFLSFAHARFRADPGIHIFHYGNYEVSALLRLASRHATAEDELDDLLRHEVFVDVLQVVRQGLRVGTATYSLKDIERLYGTRRDGEVATAVGSVVQYARWLEEPDGIDAGSSKILGAIRDYNRADCESLRQLVVWLRDRQSEERIAYVPPSRKADEVPFIPEAWKAAEAISTRLLARLPAERQPTEPDRRLDELFGHLVTFHRRESKPVFQELYPRRKKNSDELVEDSSCLGGLRRTERDPAPWKDSLAYEYRFDPDQDSAIKKGDSCFIHPTGHDRVTVHDIDLAGGRVEIRLGADRHAPPSDICLIPDEFVDPEPIAVGVRRIVEGWEQNRRIPPALEDLLRRRAPRLVGEGKFRAEAGGDQAAFVARIAAGLDRSCLAVQGPPGTGKTYAAGYAIARLVRSGKRVAVTSNSHLAIRNVLGEVMAAAKTSGEAVRVARIGTVDEEPDEEVEAFRRIGDIDFGAQESPQVVGGTAWAFSSSEAQGRFDHLFVDEAGQVPLANVVGMAACAENLVLFGDQRQLSHPTRAVHPGESGLSALAYFLQEHTTVPPELGAFLGRTRRLPESICTVVSDAFYEGRLERDPAQPARSLRSGTGRSRLGERGTGIVFVPVEHEGNTRSSDEEVEIVRAVVEDLKGASVIEGGPPRPIVADDIIVVTPYNLQVRALAKALPGIRVGTVDRFQGQQATIVVISMCASSGEDCARGLDFLFDPHRLNVAISRATVMAVVVGHPGLARSRVTGVPQLKRVNLFARLGATTVKFEQSPAPRPKTVTETGSNRSARAAEAQERFLAVSASNTAWSLDDQAVSRFLVSMNAPEDGPDWFELRRRAESLALTPSFSRLITLEFNAIQELPHQIAVARQVLNRPMSGRAILADEVGLGKTIEAGIILKELAVRGLARRILILAPAALVEQWREELLSKFFETFHTPTHAEEWEHATRAIVSYDRARQKEHKPEILRHKWDLVIADEAHKVKNHETQNYLMLSQLNRNFVLLLTATPLQNDLRELYNLVTLLRPGQLGTWSDFRRKYVLGGDKRKAKNPEALRELTSQVMVRTRRANVASTIRLPARRPSHPVIELGLEEGNLYRDTIALLRDLYREGFYQPDEAEEEADRVRRKRYTGKGNLSRMMMLLTQRLCSSPQALAESLVNLAEGEHILPAYRTRALALSARAAKVTKLAKLEALVELLVSTPDRVIVFTDHIPTLRLIEKRVSELGRVPITYDGGVPRPERNERIGIFRRTEGAVFLTTRAGGEGLNLQFCHWLVNYELPWNPMVVEQRIGRVHRIGQEHEVRIVNFAARGTIESHVLRLLDEKIKLFELVVGELDVILGKFGDSADTVEKQLREALLSSKDDEEFEEKVAKIGDAIVESREEGLKQEAATSEIAAEDAGGCLEREFAVLSIPARIRLGYGTIHLRVARGVEAKRNQLGLRVPEIIEALDAARAEPAGRHVDYGQVHRVTGTTGRGRSVSAIVQAESLPMVLVDLDAALDGSVRAIS